MAWPEEQASDWDVELQRMRYVETLGFPAPGASAMDMPAFYENATGGSRAEMSDASMARPHAAAFNQHAQQPHTLTYSASCPSFTQLYELSSDDDLIRDIQRGSGATTVQQRANGFMTGNMANNLPLHHPSHHPEELQSHPSAGMPHQFLNEKNYDYLMQMQHEHMDANLRHYPHQQTSLTQGHDHFAVFNQPRRPLHASMSFTSLSSMETEYRRRSVDSTATTAPSPATSMEFSSHGGSNFASTPEPNFLEEVPDAEMIGFSIDDFPSTFTSDASWPMPLTLGGSNTAEFESQFTNDDDAATDLLNDITSAQPLSASQDNVANENSGDKSADSAAVDSNQSAADIDLLLSDQERANMSSLFDAIRDFESPANGAPTAQTPTTTASEPQQPRKEPRQTAAKKKKTLSPPLHPSRPRKGSMDRKTSNNKQFSLLSTSAPPSVSFMKIPEHEPAEEQQSISNSGRGEETKLSVRARLQTVLSTSRSNNSDERTPLTDFERNFLELSPLFSPAKASETAGSLWLLLHAADCEFGCSIAGCNVMRRVVKHCLGCDVVVGKCKDPCNEAKTMLLHFGSCRNADNDSPCSVCRKLKEIDNAHNALRVSTPSPQQQPSTPPFLPIPMGPTAGMGHGRVPIAPQPKFGSSPQLRPAPANPASGGSKHVPIQPNPLPTSSNPMGLMGSFPQFGYSLSLYLEQTSLTFRAEVKARVEKRVTSAAGQDLILHMQKKTRLRSLDDLRAEARTLVLGELERELHFHMQAYSWASANSPNGTGDHHATAMAAHRHLGEAECVLPPYLLNVAAANFAAFYSQQASFHAAMTGMGTSPNSSSAGTGNGTSTSKSGASLPIASTPPMPRRKASIGSIPTTSTGGIAGSSAQLSAKKKALAAGIDKKKSDAASAV
uniref:TAZ-type domain-containing protein n=1 Tax=Globisporangium ultimum (strain ATCC 200006 / CBS 805.95 / DAOM BR144) TaxID=431595 RepID=K3XAN9_GLOUD